MKTHKEHIPFYSITGGPEVGKTTLFKELQNRGMIIIPEGARELIKGQQEIDGEALPWKNKKLYMVQLFERSVKSFENTLESIQDNNPVLFDRGFLDSLCYAALEGITIDPEMKSYVENHRYNNDVFILPPWKDIFETDAQRKQEWNEAVFTYNKVIQTYRGYQYNLIEVPKTSVEKRADFIMDHIKRN